MRKKVGYGESEERDSCRIYFFVLDFGSWECIC